MHLDKLMVAWATTDILTSLEVYGSLLRSSGYSTTGPIPSRVIPQLNNLLLQYIYIPTRYTM